MTLVRTTVTAVRIKLVRLVVSSAPPTGEMPTFDLNKTFCAKTEKILQM